jgi:predicted dehydrogenase
VHVITRQGEALGCYSLNQHQAPNEVMITVVCERGTVRAELHRNRWRWMTQPGDDWRDEEQGELSRDDGFIAQANRFLDAVEGKEPPLCSLSEGLQTLRVNLAVLAAAESDGWRTVASS